MTLNRNIAKVALGVCALIAFTATAGAQGRPDTRSYGCAQVQAIINQSTAIVLSNGPYTYDRYVSRRNYCGLGQEAVYDYVPAADTPRCRVGYKCRERIFNER